MGGATLGREGDKVFDMLEVLENRVAKMTDHLEKMKFAEYVSLVQAPRKMIWVNFIIGLSRGFGIAIGATVLGAMMLMLLFRLADLNLPVVGEFIARMVRIVQNHL